ncbi:MAG: PAS domain S-box protein [Humidesulfovibrio sp.]
MLHKKLNSLHARLFIIVLLAMLPVLVMALLMARDRYDEAKANAVAASRQMALQYTNEGKALFDRARLLMAEIAMLHGVHHDSEDCAKTLVALSREHPEYGAMTHSGPDGRVIASSQPQPGRRTLSGRDWFRDVLREKSFIVGGYEGGTGGEPTRLPLALPVLARDGSVLGVLSMSLDLKALADLLDGMLLPDGAAVTIVDCSGIILARRPADPLAIGRPAPEADSFLPGFLSDELNTWESAGLDGVERLYFLSPLLQQKQQGVILRIGLPKEQVFAAARHGLIRDLLFIAVMTALALFSTWFFSNAFVLGQIRKLWLATRKMSEGDYAHRIGASGSGELAELAMAFDGMADVLESKTFRLVKAERKYRMIFEHSVNGIFQTTPDGRILEANPALAGMFGYDSPEEMIRSVRDITAQLYAEPAKRTELHQRLMREGTLTGFEVPMRRRGGERIWLSLDARVVRDQDGKAAYFEGSVADITIRKMIEEELKGKQEKLQALLDYSPALISIKDAEGRYVLSNRAHQELHGQAENIIGKTVDDLFPAEEARRIREEDRQVLDGGCPVDFQRPLTINGVVHHYMVVKSPLFDASGRPDRICSIAYDITDYEQVREALRQSEEKFRTMIQTSPDLIWMLDPDGFVVEANNASRDLLGYEPEELRGMHLQQLFHPEDVQAHDRELVLDQHVGIKKGRRSSPGLINERRQLPRSTRNLAVRLIPKANGSQEPDPRHFELSSCGLWRNMAFLGTMVVIRDITERKQAEMALRESRELLAHSQAIGRIGGWSINLDTRERKWTEEMRRILGFAGGSLPDFAEAAAFVSHQDRERYAETVRRAEELGESFDVELCLAQQGTTQRWVRFMGKREDKNGARMISGSVQDITDRKNLEMLRDDIDNIIRHDLKTPLNGIINLPQIIMMGSNLTADQIELLRYIEQSGRAMLRQVEMSLDIMKIERGHFEYRPCPFNLFEVVRTVVNEMREVWQRKKLFMEVLLHGEPADDSAIFVVSGEGRLCSPMLSNLIANAIEASPAGERITIALSGTGAEHRVSIRNLGAVPVDIRERFFEKFVTRGKTKGTGLGTYSANLFARAQNGIIELDASEEGATTVIVRLPKDDVQ